MIYKIARLVKKEGMNKQNHSMFSPLIEFLYQIMFKNSFYSLYTVFYISERCFCVEGSQLHITFITSIGNVRNVAIAPAIVELVK